MCWTRLSECVPGSAQLLSKSLPSGIRTWIKTISAPASARAMAIACPIPLVPPVTIATLPLNENNDKTGADMVQCFSVRINPGGTPIDFS